jgi:anti-sigma-K factor RskA
MNDEPQNLAAEYVLGVLDEAERREAERRIAREPAFAAEVAYWEARLGALAEDVTEVGPPARVWGSIEKTLRGTSARRGLWNSLAFWRAFGVGSFGVAVAAIAAFFFIAPPMPKPMFATLQQGGAAAFIVGVDTMRGQMYIVPAAYSRDVQRVAELWLLMPDDRPKSLGLLDPAQPMTMPVPETMRGDMKEGMGLAVSLEPPGGSPTGQPTGPVVAQGKFVSL